MKSKQGIYYLELSTTELRLFGNTENKTTEDKNRENLSHQETIEVVLVNFNIVNNDYQQDSRVLYTFVTNAPFGCLLETYNKFDLFKDI